MNKYIFNTLTVLTLTLPLPMMAQQTHKHDSAVADTDSVEPHIADQHLEGVTVTVRRPGTLRSSGIENSSLITNHELLRAACCNLGESFVTNPSVDVSYSDAATGAKQIKLLGLSGTYVQMMAENIPDWRGAATPYALGYIPGPWMKSIQVSKGASSVKNGYESITGQINVEYKKPQDNPQFLFNAYGNSMGKMDLNTDGNIHLNKKWSTGLLLHYENNFAHHDNKDGFLDEPRVRQYNISNKWAYMGNNYMFQAGISGLKENREGGQTDHSVHVHADPKRGLFKINMETERYEAFAKNAFILDAAHATNVALILSGKLHNLDSDFGTKGYDVNQKEFYSSLLFETKFNKMHSLSAGLSFVYDYYDQTFNLDPSATTWQKSFEKEAVPGAYAQYTFNLNDKLVVMGGIRADHSSIYGTFVTPRAHIKWAPNPVVSFRASVGKGYRTVHPLAENHYLLSSGRQLVIDNLDQEQAWNYGLSSTLYIPLFGKNLNVNLEYYYTRFGNQAVVDYDSNPEEIRIGNLQGKSYSHTFQADATYSIFSGMTLTAAYRLNRAKTTYGGVLMDRPLTGKYKGLVTASYKTPLGLWQVDATWALNGGGRMPTPYTTANGTPSWDSRYPAFSQVSAQVTRWFRHFSVYIGGENLTNFKQKNPIIGANDPWGKGFEPTLIWGPVQGAMVYVGIRVNFEKLK